MSIPFFFPPEWWHENRLNTSHINLYLPCYEYDDSLLSVLNQAWLLALYQDQTDGAVGFLPRGRDLCNTLTQVHRTVTDFFKGQNNND